VHNCKIAYARVVELQWSLMVYVSSILTSSDCSESAESVVSQAFLPDGLCGA